MMRYPQVFRMNEETSINNYFQQQYGNNNGNVVTNEMIQQLAQQEFDNFVALLREKGVNVIVINERTDQQLDIPDAIFPNNWITFHEDGKVCYYPMYAANRRRERLPYEYIQNVMSSHGYSVTGLVDMSPYEDRNMFLEGTGVLILDHVAKLAYCSLSARADEELLQKFCHEFSYQPISFTAYQTHAQERKPIYHTNVLMALGDSFVIICLSSIDNEIERNQLITSFQQTGKEIIDITEEQVSKFAGNMLQVCSVSGSQDQDTPKKYLVMSTTAYRSLRVDQIEAIERYSEIIHSPLPTIELCGGGSARCMLAEVFLPKLNS